jgi:tRNA threonylcarbamoyl adenosine modification protein (Sua5/YciO/YrdC/YwlC family)
MGAVSIDDAVAALRAGQVVVVPTDTVYGIAVDPARPGATDRLFVIKERPTDVALPVLAADAEQAFSLAADVPQVARDLADAFWPGGLTLVLRRRAGLGYDLGGPDDATIGVRVPDHEVPRALAAAVGPLATTSANLHGRPTPETAAEVAAELTGVAVVLDGGRCAGVPSTVVVCTGGRPVVVRDGRIGIHQLEQVTSYRFDR